MTELKIGRNKDCDIVIDDPTASRIHATLMIKDDGWFIKDNDSANGTFINGNKISGTVSLKENDILKIGNTVVPWRNYITIKKTIPTPAPAPPVIPPVKIIRKKKQGSGALVAGIIIVVLLLGLVAYFIIHSNRDELRISDTWVCNKNCGSLNRLTFSEAVNKKGTYSTTDSAGNSIFKGYYSINTDTKFIKLTALPDTVNSLTNPAATYKYKMEKNTLELTSMENSVQSPEPIVLVKLR